MGAGLTLKIPDETVSDCEGLRAKIRSYLWETEFQTEFAVSWKD